MPINKVTKLLNKVSNLKEVEDMEIINIPDDVEADIGLKIKLKKKAMTG